ncbi:hypothetical protein Q7C36_003824 [Tachysurus vachellii]|uniref:Uncharacterized protein n=1 Tax=Tachysurus vachellii TaxID=175792 RepID=A0AA88NVF3_TACVA|nr:hypothetical protein Q7C36_003824 [Tachysurus vachellii]
MMGLLIVGLFSCHLSHHLAINFQRAQQAVISIAKMWPERSRLHRTYGMAAGSLRSELPSWRKDKVGIPYRADLHPLTNPQWSKGLHQSPPPSLLSELGFNQVLVTSNCSGEAEEKA